MLAVWKMDEGPARAEAAAEKKQQWPEYTKEEVSGWVFGMVVGV